MLLKKTVSVFYCLIVVALISKQSFSNSDADYWRRRTVLLDPGERDLGWKDTFNQKLTEATPKFLFKLGSLYCHCGDLRLYPPYLDSKYALIYGIPIQKQLLYFVSDTEHYKKLLQNDNLASTHKEELDKFLPGSMLTYVVEREILERDPDSKNKLAHFLNDPTEIFHFFSFKIDTPWPANSLEYVKEDDYKKMLNDPSKADKYYFFVSLVKETKERLFYHPSLPTSLANAGCSAYSWQTNNYYVIEASSLGKHEVPQKSKHYDALLKWNKLLGVNNPFGLEYFNELIIRYSEAPSSFHYNLMTNQKTYRSLRSVAEEIFTNIFTAYYLRPVMEKLFVQVSSTNDSGIQHIKMKVTKTSSLKIEKATPQGIIEVVRKFLIQEDINVSPEVWLELQLLAEQPLPDLTEVDDSIEDNLTETTIQNIFTILKPPQFESSHITIERQQNW